MKRDTAFKLLGLSQSVTADDIKASFDERFRELLHRLEQAPTPELRSKYEAELQVLEDARQAALSGLRPTGSSLSATQIQDLPMTTPHFTGDAGVAEHESVRGARVNLHTGDELSGRYTIRRRIGIGGMGAVYAAYDQIRGHEVALKVLLPELLASERARERFLNEARVSSDLSHPNIVTVYDVQQDREFYFITMKLLEGATLRQEIDRRKLEERSFSVAEVTKIAEGLCDALEYAHRFTVHRDIKPENVWINLDGSVTLMDFGIARAIDESSALEGAAMGTAYYSAPEQLRDPKRVTHRADQYGLAVLIYELLANRLPTGRTRPLRELRNDVPQSFSAAVDRALESDPDDRFENVAAFRRSLLSRSKSLGKPALTLRVDGQWQVLGIAALACVIAGILFFNRDFVSLKYREWTRNEEQTELAHVARDAATAALRAWEVERDKFELTDPVAVVEARATLAEGDACINELRDKDAESKFELATRKFQEGLQASQPTIDKINKQNREAASGYKGTALQLQEKIETKRRDMQSELTAYAHSIVTLDGKMHGARTDADRASYEQQLAVAKDKESVQRLLLDIATSEVFDSKESTDAAESIAIGTDAFKAEEYATARDAFKAAVEILSKQDAYLERIGKVAAIPNETDSLGNTAAHRAATDNDPVLVGMLVHFGHDLNAKNNAGDMPLHVASANQKWESAAKLVELGAIADQPDHDGITPLRRALNNAPVAFGKELIRSGANPNERTGEEASILDEATVPEWADLLKDHGALPGIDLALVASQVEVQKAKQEWDEIAAGVPTSRLPSEAEAATRQMSESALLASQDKRRARQLNIDAVASFHKAIELAQGVLGEKASASKSKQDAAATKERWLRFAGQWSVTADEAVVKGDSMFAAGENAMARADYAGATRNFVDAGASYRNALKLGAFAVRDSLKSRFDEFKSKGVIRPSEIERSLGQMIANADASVARGDYEKGASAYQNAYSPYVGGNR